MKRLLLAITIVSSLLGSNPKQELKTNPEIYPTTLEVISITDSQMICETASGIIYTISESEDMVVGDLVAVIMNTNGTENTILDDYVVSWRYSGYWAEDETEDEEGGA